jgi:beta-glucanase (GH16 family)
MSFFVLLTSLAFAQQNTSSVAVKTSSSAPAASSAPVNTGPPLGSTGTGPAYTGNCLTQKIDFTEVNRIYNLNGMARMDWDYSSQLDIGRYDMTIDYFSSQVQMTGKGGVTLKITANPDSTKNALAPRLSTTRFMRYGKVSAVLSAPAIPGVVTTFVTMGPNLSDSGLDLKGTDTNSGDEIDWEIVGGDATHAQSNLFYRGFKDYGVRGAFHNVSLLIYIR